MRSRKSTWVAGAVVALSLGLAACSSGSAPSATGASQPAGKVSLSWGFWNQGDDGNKRWAALADEVSKQDPNIEVKVTAPPFADYFTKLQSQLASNSAPCIVSMQSLRLPGFVQAMEPLDDLMSKQGFKSSDWNPAALKALQRDGKQYAIPYGVSTMALFYNKDLLKEAGVAEPKPGWTIADFESMAKEIKAKTGKPAFGLSFSDLHMFTMLQAYNGAKPVSDNGQLDLTNPQMVKAFEWYSGLATKEKIALVPASSSDIPWGEQQFVAGNAAMAVDGTWNLATNAKDATFHVGVVSLPVGPGGISSFSANSGFGIAKSCPHKEQAAKAIAVITGADAQRQIAAAGTLPARVGVDKAFYEGLTSSADPKTPGFTAQAKTAIEDSSATAIPFIPSQNWDQTTKAISREFILAYTGGQSPEGALQKAQSAAK